MTGAARALDGLRILVVDDNQDSLDALAMLLVINGAEVTSCRSALEARRLLADSRADLVISDLTMPDEDGFDLIMSIRSLGAEAGGQTPAIAYSAADPVARARALACGYQAFVPKLEFSQLLGAVARLTARGAP